MVMILICHPLGIYHHYHPLLFGPQPVMCVKGSRLGLGEKSLPVSHVWISLNPKLSTFHHLKFLWTTYRIIRIRCFGLKKWADATFGADEVMQTFSQGAATWPGLGIFHKWGYSKMDGLFMEHPKITWMMDRGYPNDFGNLHCHKQSFRVIKSLVKA